MSEITIFLLYIIAAASFGASRLAKFQPRVRVLFMIATIAVALSITLHAELLFDAVFPGEGLNLSLSNTVSMIGLELAIIALIAALNVPLRGISMGLLLIGAAASLATLMADSTSVSNALEWQVRAHVVVSLLSYGLLTVGAIVAVFALVQHKRLQAKNISSANNLFAPLETTEGLLFGITAAGFTGLALAILTGLTFVDNLFAQHLAHKTAFSLLALAVFGTLLGGRYFRGWRGTRAVNFYLSGFVLLCLAYFGVRLILEQVLGRSWS